MSEWISVKTSLPNETETVLIYFDHDSYAVGFCIDGEFDSYDGAFSSISLVSHWMPLPEAPIIQSATSQSVEKTK